MLDVQDLFILGSRVGLLADLIVLGNFLLKGRARRWKSISEGSPNKGAEAGGLSTSLQGCWRARPVPAAGEPQDCAALESRAAAGGRCLPRGSSAAVQTNNSQSALKMLQSGTRARKSRQSCCCCACCQGGRTRAGDLPQIPPGHSEPGCRRAQLSRGSQPCRSGSALCGLCCADHGATLERDVPVLFRAGTVQGRASAPNPVTARSAALAQP